MNREQGGQLVRQAWVEYCRETGDLKPSHLLLWDRLSEWDKEADRRIFDALHRAIRAELRADPTCPNCASNQSSATETTAMLGRIVAARDEMQAVSEGLINLVLDTAQQLSLEYPEWSLLLRREVEHIRQRARRGSEPTESGEPTVAPGPEPQRPNDCGVSGCTLRHRPQRPNDCGVSGCTLRHRQMRGF